MKRKISSRHSYAIITLYLFITFYSEVSVQHIKTEMKNIKYILINNIFFGLLLNQLHVELEKSIIIVTCFEHVIKM